MKKLSDGQDHAHALHTQSSGITSSFGTMKAARRMGTAMMGRISPSGNASTKWRRTSTCTLSRRPKKLMPGVTKDVMDSPENLWMKGLTKEQIQQQVEYYKKRYNQ